MNPSVAPPAPLLPDNIQTLPELERESWQQLVMGTQKKPGQKDNGSGFRTMVVATNTPDGAEARMVVLRKVDDVRRYLWFHTDARARKVMQLEAFPNISLLFWDEHQQLQLRLRAETRLHTDDYVADEHWRNLWVGSRKMYLSEPAPGSGQASSYPGFPAHLGESLPTETASEAGRKNFAVIECRVTSLEYLHLARSGHTRAQFDYEPERKLTWLAP